MYNFIYFVIYNQQIKKGGSETFSRYNGSLIVSFALIVHFAFLGLIMKLIVRYFNNAFFNIKINKVFFVPFVLGVMVMTIIYYNTNRTKIILNKYSTIVNPTSSGNFLKLLSIIFIPLIIGAILSNK